MYRIEKKFLFNNEFESSIFLISLLKKFSFRKIFQPRIIYSTYFDSFNLDFLGDNISGLSDRKKIRIRFYQNNMKTLIYEEKIKKNNFSKKIKKELGINKEDLNFNKALKLFRNNKFYNKINNRLQDKINVQYNRCYYIDKYGNNLTIDTDIEFSENSFKNKYNYSKSIIEYKISLDNYNNQFFHKINFPYTRHSKYVAGMSVLNKTTYV